MKRQPKKPRKLTKAKLKKKARTARRNALHKWSLDVRARDSNACCVCGKLECLNAHHLLPKERYPEFEVQLNNGITLCPTHHKFGKESAHRNGIWFSEWLKEFKPELFQIAIERLKQ